MILQAEAVSLQLSGNTILNEIDFSLNKGELVGLIGPNGAGKTSLLRVLAKLQKPCSGQLQLESLPIQHYSAKQLARKIAYLAQGAPSHWPLQVKRLIELGRLPYMSPFTSLSHEDRLIVDRAMAQAEVEHLSHRIISTLSGGERLRVLMARVFATNASIILADEPIAALDLYHQLHIMELLREHCDQGGSAVVVMHDLNMAARFCQRLVIMQGGEIVDAGSPDKVLNEDLIARVYGIRTAIVKEHSAIHVVPQQRL